MKENLHLFIYLFIAVSSSLFIACNKVEFIDVRPDENRELISEAMDGYENYVKSISKSQDDLMLSWNLAKVVNYGEIATNIEVPITDFKGDSLKHDFEIGEINSSSICRLIARRNPKTKKFTYFIVSRVVIGKTDDLSDKKLDEISAGSVTRVYSLNGKLMNEYSSIDTKNRTQTRCSSNGVGVCTLCGAVNRPDARNCSGCKAFLIKDVVVVTNYFFDRINPIWERFLEVIDRGKRAHNVNSNNGCFGTCCTEKMIAYEFTDRFEFHFHILKEFPIERIDYYPYLGEDECKEICLHQSRMSIDGTSLHLKSGNAIDCAWNIADYYCNMWRESEINDGKDPAENLCHHLKCYECSGCLADDVDGNCKLCSCCKAPQCLICKGCFNPTHPKCKQCECPCRHPKCPICEKCFDVPGNSIPGKVCLYCTGTDKDLHLLQDSIRKKCFNVVTLFDINRPLAVTTFYKWESVDLSLALIKSIPFGLSVSSDVDGQSNYVLYEINKTQISGNQIGLPKDLLINRNTDKLAATFLHELFHANQSFDLLTAMANAEVEAKLAKLIFAQQAGISQQNTEGDVNFYNDLCRLRSYINDNGSVNSKYLNTYDELYKELLNYISRTFNYPKDNTINGDLSLPTLRFFL